MPPLLLLTGSMRFAIYYNAWTRQMEAQKSAKARRPSHEQLLCRIHFCAAALVQLPMGKSAQMDTSVLAIRAKEEGVWGRAPGWVDGDEIRPTSPQIAKGAGRILPAGTIREKVFGHFVVF